MEAWTDIEKAELRRLWDIYGGKCLRIGCEMGRSKGSISGMSRRLDLQFHGGRAVVLKDDHAAVTEGRSLFPSRVFPPTSNVLKSGDNQRKLGKEIEKGRWKGFPVFSLSLEERATCPTTCAMYRGCYGNNMVYAKRYEHGPDLEQQIITDLARLEIQHPRGFVVRLHLLGDFYSVAYVEFWAFMLETFPGLHIFGYTAWTWNTGIGQAVSKLRNSNWERFAVRTSGAKKGLRTIVFHAKAPKSVIPCPAQDGKTASCSTCGLCWQTKRAIGFRAH